MATKIWTGGASNGDWTDAGNWSGGVPVNGDDVFIPEGAEAITTNLGQSAVTLDSLTVTFAQDIGTAAASLEINVSGVCTIAGRGSTYKINGTIADLVVQLPESATCYLSGGTTADADLVSGNLQIEAAATVTNLYANGGSVTALAGTVFTFLGVNGAQVETLRGATTAHVVNGRLIVQGTSAWTTVFGWQGGILDIRTTGTMAAVDMNSGSQLLIMNATQDPAVTNLFIRGTANVQRNARGISLNPTTTSEFAAAG